MKNLHIATLVAALALRFAAAGPGDFTIYWTAGTNSLPGCTVGLGNGSYTPDFGSYLATQAVDAILRSGATVWMQAWYRDPGVAATAVYSNAMSFDLVP